MVIMTKKEDPNIKWHAKKSYYKTLRWGEEIEKEAPALLAKPLFSFFVVHSHSSVSCILTVNSSINSRTLASALTRVLTPLALPILAPASAFIIVAVASISDSKTCCNKDDVADSACSLVMIYGSLDSGLHITSQLRGSRGCGVIVGWYGI